MLNFKITILNPQINTIMNGTYTFLKYLEKKLLNKCNKCIYNNYVMIFYLKKAISYINNLYNIKH